MIRCTRSLLALKCSFFTFVGLGFRKFKIWRKFRSIKFKTLWGLPKYLWRSIREEESMVVEKKLPPVVIAVRKRFWFCVEKTAMNWAVGPVAHPCTIWNVCLLNRVPKHQKNAPLILGILYPRNLRKRWKPKRSPRKRKASVSWKPPLMWSKMFLMIS